MKRRLVGEWKEITRAPPDRPEEKEAEKEEGGETRRADKEGPVDRAGERATKGTE